MEIRREDGYPVIGMILGDGSGVGSEITAKLAGKGVLTDGARPIILGDGRLWEYAAGKFAPGVSWHVFEKAEDVDWEHGLPVLHVGEQKSEDIVFGQVNQMCGKACLDMLRFAVRLYLDGVIDGVCYAPLNKTAMKLAGTIAKNAPVAVRACKKAINEGTQVDMDSAIVIEEKLFGSCFETEDQREGMQAFLEKRKVEGFKNR